MSDKMCIYCVVRGRVQGVWFRAKTQEKARQLGLSGWVQNGAGGEVTVLACGPKEQLEELYTWLHKGPPLAKVSEVTRENREWVEYLEFTIT